MAKLGIAVVAILVSVIDSAGSDDFGLWPYLVLTPFKENVQNPIKKYSLRDFDCRLTHLARLLVHELGRGRGVIFPPPPPARRVRLEAPALRGPTKLPRDWAVMVLDELKVQHETRKESPPKLPQER